MTVGPSCVPWPASADRRVSRKRSESASITLEPRTAATPRFSLRSKVFLGFHLEAAYVCAVYHNNAFGTGGSADEQAKRSNDLKYLGIPKPERRGMIN